jgi:hypothetical protein
MSVDIPFMQSLAATFGLPPSAFTVSSTEEYEPRIHTKGLLVETPVIKLILPPAIHHDALQDLWNMNVTAATLFPGLDGFARSLHYYLKIDDFREVKYAKDILGIG